MKKFSKYYLCTLACAIAVSSCSLDETSYTEIEKGNYMNNATEAENVLLGVYRNMVQDGIYGFHLSLYFTIPSDIAKVTGNSTDGLRLIPSNAYTSSQTEIATTWANLYNAIYSANDFIEALQQKIGTYDETNYKKGSSLYGGSTLSTRPILFRSSTLVSDMSINYQYRTVQTTSLYFHTS